MNSEACTTHSLSADKLMSLSMHGATRALSWRACAAAQAEGLAIREEAHASRVPRSQRGGDVVEPLVREQWFVRMEPLAKPALEVRPRKNTMQS